MKLNDKNETKSVHTWDGTSSQITDQSAIALRWLRTLQDGKSTFNLIVLNSLTTSTASATRGQKGGTQNKTFKEDNTP